MEKLDVIMISAPFDFPPRPSLALALFKPQLRNAGLSNKTLYPMVEMCRLLGKETIQFLIGLKQNSLYEEYIFSGLTGQKDYSDIDDYIDTLYGKGLIDDKSYFKSVLQKCIDVAQQVVEQTAEEICSYSPKVLAASSVFAQQNGTLAILKRVKEMLPQVKTIVGGPNCDGKAGLILLKRYAQVDTVFFGEGDEVFGQAIKSLINGETLPYGILTKSDIDKFDKPNAVIPYRLTKDLDTCPIPEFDDFTPYIAKIPKDQLPLMNTIFMDNGKPVLMIEGSRGCWWADKHPCTFCTLNGENCSYRFKSFERLYKEICELTEKYDTPFIEFTDNIISNEMIKDLLPTMAEAPKRLTVIMAEIKPILKEEEVFALKAAGIHHVQPGIENLNGHLIQLMGKGNSSIGHISFLKYCRRSGVKPFWNMLCRIPGQGIKDYEMLIDLLPKLFHLPPPIGCTKILFERGSCYCKNPEKYGLTLTPDALYKYAFIDDKEIIDALALYYEDSGPEKERLDSMESFHLRLSETIEKWKNGYTRNGGCHLIMADTHEVLTIVDTRHLNNSDELQEKQLKGIYREICLICNNGKSLALLEKDLKNKYSNNEISEAISFLEEKAYLISDSNYLLSLPTLGSQNQINLLKGIEKMRVFQ